MALQRFSQLGTSGTGCRRVLREPLMHQAMRAAEDIGAAATWLDVVQHDVYEHSAGRKQLTGVAAIQMPARVGHVPVSSGRKVQKEGAPVLRHRQFLARQYLFDGSDCALTADGPKRGMAFQVLQVFGPSLGPCGRVIAADPDVSQRVPNDFAHKSRRAAAKGTADAQPAESLKVFQISLR